jgi:lycopene beta-cyclase
MIAALGETVRLDARVIRLEATHVELDGGQIVHARCVIDGRGPEPSPHLQLGFQKFTGQVLRLEEPHALTGPIIMDATVPQEGDYRFFYTLPLGPTELMVEDTRYSNSASVDPERDGQAIAGYAADRGWRVTEVERVERGVLPITLGGDIDAFWAGREIPRIGLRAALFHATTGYSLADAVRTADAIAASRITSTERMFSFLADRSKRHWRAQAYWRLLNRMLFIAARPEQRRGVMARFYRLRQPLIERFYSGRSSVLDKIRILTGKPPVAILPALRCLHPGSASANSTEGSS